jgi:hypothetical protein
MGQWISRDTEISFQRACGSSAADEQPSPTDTGPDDGHDGITVRLGDLPQVD